MQKVIAATAAFLALGATALAADKGGPPATLAQIQAMPPVTTLTRCYVETSLVGTFLAAGDRTAQGSVGGGCDLTAGGISLGALGRVDFGDATTGSIAAKLGYAINPHLTAYGLAEWRVPEIKINRSGSLFLGGGLETAIAVVNGLSVFGEASISAAKFGSAATKDDVSTRAGLRYRF